MKENFKESCNELFVNENNTIIVKKELACLLGLNEAIVLNQVRYWIDINEKARKNFKDGKYWCYNTYDEWKMNNFPF